MKLRTLTALNDRLDAELSRRKREISGVKGVIARNAEPARRSLLRGGVMLLYANWEGFVKDTSISYINFVSYQGLDRAVLADHILAIVMRAELLGCGVKKPSAHNEVVGAIRRVSPGPVAIPWSAVVDTKDNLRADALREIVQLLGLDYLKYAAREVFIDKQLCDRRNEIAHGSVVAVTNEEYEELNSGVLALLDLFRDDVSDAAARGTYRL